MRILFDPEDAKYVVLRRASEMPPGQMPPELDGRWDDRERYRHLAVQDFGAAPNWAGWAIAQPSNHFEVRSDGEIAQVWLVRWKSP